MSPLGPGVRAFLMVTAWLVWLGAFVMRRSRRRGKAVRIETKARWGMLLEFTGYWVAQAHGPAVWASDLEVWRAVAGAVFAAAAAALAWNAVGKLGRQWRVDAGLNQDHELVQSGAYRLVRHPIYASMAAMLLAVIFWTGTLPGWPVAIVLFVTGTEIRVRVEDGLLSERFGERFAEWRRSVPAYLPFIR